MGSSDRREGRVQPRSAEPPLRTSYRVRSPGQVVRTNVSPVRPQEQPRRVAAVCRRPSRSPPRPGRCGDVPRGRSPRPRRVEAGVRVLGTPHSPRVVERGRDTEPVQEPPGPASDSGVPGLRTGTDGDRGTPPLPRSQTRASPQRRLPSPAGEPADTTPRSLSPRATARSQAGVANSEPGHPRVVTGVEQPTSSLLVGHSDGVAAPRPTQPGPGQHSASAAHAIAPRASSADPHSDSLHRCQRLAVGSGPPQLPYAPRPTGVQRLVHGEPPPCAHNGEGSLGGLLGLDKPEARNTRRCASAPPGGLSTSLLRVAPLEDEEPQPPRPVVRDSSDGVAEAMALDAEVGPQRGEPSGPPLPCGEGLRRLQAGSEPAPVRRPRPTPADPVDRSHDDVRQPAVQEVHGPHTATARSGDRRLFDPPPGHSGQGSVCQPTVGLHSETTSARGDAEVRPDTPPGHAKVGLAAVVEAPTASPADFTLVPAKARDLLGPQGRSDAVTAVVDGFLSDLRADHKRAGTQPVVLECMLSAYQGSTLQRYAYGHRNWLRDLGVDSLSSVSPDMCAWKLNEQLRSRDRPSVLCERYCVARLFPSIAGVFDTPLLKRWRQQVTKSVPKHDQFFDLTPVIQAECAKPFDWMSEETVRMRLVLTLSVFFLARAWDIAHLQRKVQVLPGGALRLTWKRKFWSAPRTFVCQKNTHHEWSVPALVSAYLGLTDPHINPDDHPEFMLVSLPVRDGFKYQIKPDRVRSLRREFLASHGIDVRSSKTERTEFGQHSIRGASVALLDMYIDKTEIIAKLGDWDRYDTFLNYYYKLHADRSAGTPNLGELYHGAVDCPPLKQFAESTKAQFGAEPLYPSSASTRTAKQLTALQAQSTETPSMGCAERDGGSRTATTPTSNNVSSSLRDRQSVGGRLGAGRLEPARSAQPSRPPTPAAPVEDSAAPVITPAPVARKKSKKDDAKSRTQRRSTSSDARKPQKAKRERAPSPPTKGRRSNTTPAPKKRSLIPVAVAPADKPQRSTTKPVVRPPSPVVTGPSADDMLVALSAAKREVMQVDDEPHKVVMAGSVPVPVLRKDADFDDVQRTLAYSGDSDRVSLSQAHGDKSM